MKETDILSNPQIMIIFTYAPAGLGHLRVTDNLYHGMPKGITPILLGSEDTSVGILHRLMSIHPISRSIMEYLQHGWPEDLFTILYRNWLHKSTPSLFHRLETLLKQRIVLPKTILVVSTHFGLAHQLSGLKQKLISENGLRVFLIVQVTDDSPQHVWYIPGADLTFVPSELTKNKLAEYGRKAGLPKIQFEVNPYPVSPILARDMPKEKYDRRKKQLTQENNNPIQVILPVSGAAVGMKFISDLINELNILSPRFNFQVVSKITPYTSSFLKDLEKRSKVQLHAFYHDREVVDSYERVYQENIISLEVTKPSEQAFKSLISPRQTGGSILLFSRPVGRQEYDNLDFLTRHKLIPDRLLQQKLWRMAADNYVPPRRTPDQVLRQAEYWRGLRLPEKAREAAIFIVWCLMRGMFASMLSGQKVSTSDETSDRGVELFWQKTAEFLKVKILG